ncbi:MAG: hypothetical protein A3K83_06745 [Omnitrophica WOR_2 bacterium RBG_13_44_8b]|nr:MAG: hypothetical protein A3K83_06745 [Omnitrophica WOR_2 bacterium RBG_13_44_8b]
MPPLFKKIILIFCLSLFAVPLINYRAAALDKKASLALSHYILGVMYEDLGDIEAAIDEYKRALKADDKNSLIHLNLAGTLIKKNEIPKAIDELKQAGDLDPEAVEPHAILALLYSSQNRQDLATAEYEVALKNASRLQPKNIEVFKSLGALYLEQKKFKEAEDIYRLVLNLSPEDAQAHFYLGSIYSELKKDDLAKAEMKRAIELNPDYHQALNFLGYLYVEENKNLDQAEALIKKAVELDPDNGAYIDSLGWLYFKRDKYQEALKELEKASTLLDDPVIFDHLGEVYLKIRDYEKARQAWQQSLKLEPNQDKVKKKIEALSEYGKK